MSTPDGERRMYTRSACSRPVSIVIGPGTLVFCRLRNHSPGGLCLSPPRNYRVTEGDHLELDVDGRLHVTVVAASPDCCHCTFTRSRE